AAQEPPAAEPPAPEPTAGPVVEAWRQSRLYDLLYGSPAAEPGPAAAEAGHAAEPGLVVEPAGGPKGPAGDQYDESQSKPISDGEISALELVRNADLSGAMPMYGAL
ncbi:unnamed protein product, partial [Prorocentrum cordatum]